MITCAGCWPTRSLDCFWCQYNALTANITNKVGLWCMQRNQFGACVQIAMRISVDAIEPARYCHIHMHKRQVHRSVVDFRCTDLYPLKEIDHRDSALLPFCPYESEREQKEKTEEQNAVYGYVIDLCYQITTKRPRTGSRYLHKYSVPLCFSGQHAEDEGRGKRDSERVEPKSSEQRTYGYRGRPFNHCTHSPSADCGFFARVRLCLPRFQHAVAE